MTTPADLLPPSDQPATVPDPTIEAVRGEALSPAVTRDKRITCEFCKCKLTHNGDVLTMSDEARNFRDMDDDMDELKRQLDEANRDAAEFKRRADAAEAELERRKGSWL